MCSEKELYGVSLFDGDSKNFSVWKRRVIAVFAAKDLEDFLEKEPDENSAAEKGKAKKAYALLLSLLSDNVVISLQNESTACEIWKKLERTYDTKRAVNQILIRKRLATIKKSRDICMRSHIDQINKLISDLKLSGAEVSDTDTIVYVLMSLPQEYESVKTALENQPNENLTLDFVSQRLLDAEALLNESRKEKVPFKPAHDNTAFMSIRKEFFCKNCKQKGHTAKYCRKKIICYSCGKLGHFKRDCKSVKLSNEEKCASSAVSFVAGNIIKNDFIVDSGATSHMCSIEKYFKSIVPSSGTVKCASKSTTLEIKGVGNIVGKISDGTEITLKDVLYVPDLNGQLISVRKIESANYAVIFQNEKVFIEKERKRFCFGMRDLNGQYISDFVPNSEIVLLSKDDDHTLWHRRLGHPCDKVLKEMGLPTPSSFCDVCVRAKQSATPIGKGPRKREAQPMMTIHTDVCGPIDPVTFSGERYFMSIIDDFSRFTEIRLLKHKSEVSNELKVFLKANPTVKKIRCDNAKEYLSSDFVNFTKETGVVIDPAPPYTPSLNGVAERANRTLLDKGRALIADSNLPKTFWGQAILTAAYLKNRMPSNSIDNCTPYYLKFGEDPDLKQLRIFGCSAYMLVPSVHRKKLDDKSKRMIFVGYSSMGYRLVNPETKQITISRNVKFDETKHENSIKRYLVENLELPDYEFNQEEVQENASEKSEENEDDKRKSERSRKQPIRYPDPEVYEALLCRETLSFDDIKSLPVDDQQLWKKAMDEEIESMKINNVWDLEKLPPDKQAISCKWVLTKKRNGRYKARLVARGFMQKEGLDYSETFSPVISMPALRLVFVMILNEDLHAFVLDVKTAFLNGKLNELVFMDQPPGYDDNSGRKCKLKKSLYGLKQAPRQWFQRFLEFVSKLNFQSLDNEPCIFIRNSDDHKIIIALYVDDMLVAGSNVNETNVVISLLSKEFHMSKSESVSEFLGIRLTFTPDTLIMDQESYVTKLLSKFNMLECRPSDIPISPKSTPSDFKNGKPFNGPYRELVGCLLYLSYISRPDILYAVNCLSQMQENPTDIAWTALKKILRYLKGTLSLKIVYKKQKQNSDPKLCMYVDADWGADTNDRKSVSGYILMFCDMPVLWCCNKQKSVALSSTEAEVTALTKSMQDLLWFKHFACEIVNIKDLIILEDNQSCIKYISNESNHGRMKHIDIKLKFVRDAVKENNIKIEYVPTNMQIADLFTKALPKARFQELLFLCGLCK